LDPFQNIVEVHWGKAFARLEVDYPADIQFDFSVTTTVTERHYDPGQVIDPRQGVDDTAPLIEVQFNQPNPVDQHTVQGPYIYDGLFADPVAFVNPAIVVVDPIERFRKQDQDRWDAAVALFNSQQVEAFNAAVALQPGIVDAAKRRHPDGVIVYTRDLRLVLPEPHGGWGTTSVTYLPAGQWITGGGIGGGTFETFTHPDYELWVTQEGVWPYFLQPIQVGITYIKYSSQTLEGRNRDTYMVSLNNLKEQVVIVTLDKSTRETNSEVELDYFSGGGVYTAGALRVLTSDDPNEIKTTRKMDGRAPVGTVLARFDRSGFV
jgi:hypothetical protein